MEIIGAGRESGRDTPRFPRNACTSLGLHWAIDLGSGVRVNAMG